MIASSLFLSSINVAGAITATPTATPDVPSPELCTAEAPSFDTLQSILNATPQAGTPVATIPSGVIPAGTPASEEDVAGIVAVIRELVACYNAGEPLRTFGLFAPAYLHRLFERQSTFSRAEYDAMATPDPTDDPNTHTQILAIDEIRVFADGTAGANVTMRYSSIPMAKHFFFSFERVGAGWLISGILGEISFSVP